MKKRSTVEFDQVVGLDVGDRFCHLAILERDSGEILERSRVATTRGALRSRFAGVAPMRIALEVGTHSPWISRLLDELGHEVIVANARKLRLIYENRNKDDQIDAEYLARLARVDPRLLVPVEHGSAQMQADLAVIRARQALVRSRTRLVLHCQGVLKSYGLQIPQGYTSNFPRRLAEVLPAELEPALGPLVETLTRLNRDIYAYDRRIERIASERYPETALLRQIRGVGAITALAFVLILQHPGRFQKSRDVGAYLGLVPARCESGQSRPQLRIRKEGNKLLRHLLMQCAHYMMGPFGEECDLRRFGERLQARGGAGARPRACVAMARKLAVMLHHLWATGEVYDPGYQLRQRAA
jgi:transposase